VGACTSCGDERPPANLTNGVCPQYLYRVAEYDYTHQRPARQES